MDDMLLQMLKTRPPQFLLMAALWLSPGIAGAQLRDVAPLIDAAERGNIVDMQKALLAGASPNARGQRHYTSLMLAAGQGAVDIVELLLGRSAMVDLVDGEGNSALVHAALNDHVDVMALLLAAGAAIDRSNKQGETALVRAAGEGSDKAVSSLLAAGADPTLTDFTGRTAFDRAAENRRDQVMAVFRRAGINR